jgi:hypothetical protein
MRPALRSIALCGVILFGARHASADDASAFETRPTAIYAQLGLGTPLGWAGVELERTLTSFLAVSAGIGMGFAGPQLAAMPRLRLEEGRFAFTVGAGLSRGRYRWSDNCSLDCTPTVMRGTVTWANLEGGIERRLANDLSLRAFVGFGHVLVGHLTCESGTFCGATSDDGRDLGSFGAALGWAF